MQQLQERQHTLDDRYLAPLQYHWAPPFFDPPMEQLQERSQVQEVFKPEPNESRGTCCRLGTLAFIDKQNLNRHILVKSYEVHLHYTFQTHLDPLENVAHQMGGFMHCSDGF